MSKIASENIYVAFSVNDFYVPYFSAMLESALEYVDEKRNYSFLVLTSDVAKANKDVLERQLALRDNVSLHFFDTSAWMDDLAGLHLCEHFKVECYYRLLLPEMLPNHSKIVYLDSDMIAQADLAELYDVDLSGCFLAATIDAGACALYGDPSSDWKKYCDEILGLTDPLKYLQSGVLVMNLDKFRKDLPSKKMLEFASTQMWKYPDQDVLNCLTQGSVKYLDMAWNSTTDSLGERVDLVEAYAPEHIKDAFFEARRHPKIVHFAGPDKPWDFMGSDRFDLFWQFARKTPYAEAALRQSLASWLRDLDARNEDTTIKLWQAIERVWDKFGTVDQAIDHALGSREQRIEELARDLERAREALLKQEEAISLLALPLYKKVFNAFFPYNSNRRTRLFDFFERIR